MNVKISMAECSSSIYSNARQCWLFVGWTPRIIILRLSDIAVSSRSFEPQNNT